MSIERRLQELGITLPSDVTAAANYVPGVVHRGQLVLSGQTPRLGGKLAITGKVGVDVSIEEGRDAARICALRLLAVARDTLGSLDRVERVLELTVYVNASADFDEPSSIADAASQLMVDVFGAMGRHARSAVCVAQLPKNASVEISARMGVGAAS